MGEPGSLHRHPLQVGEGHGDVSASIDCETSTAPKVGRALARATSDPDRARARKRRAIPGNVDVERAMRRVAVLGPDRFLVQEPERVRIVERGAARELPASGCGLVGILDERYAVFLDYFQATHPYLVADSGFGEDHVRLEDGATVVGDTCGELSVLDLDGGRYLERAPPSLPDRWVQNDQPEDLLLVSLDREHAVRLAVGGDRPGLFAYGRDLAFAWVGEDRDTAARAPSGWSQRPSPPRSTPPGRGSRAWSASSWRSSSWRRSR